MVVLSPVAKKLRKPISPKWETFCRAYAASQNPRQACIDAGYSPAAASVQASQLLARPQIKERIAQLMAPVHKKFDITRDRVLEELAKVAFFNVKDLYDEKTGRLKPIQDLEDHVAAAISEVTEETRSMGRGEDAIDVTTKRVRQHDKMKALEMLAKHLQLYSDAPTVQVNNQINVGELRNLSERERELLRELAESRARAASADLAITGPAEG